MQKGRILAALDKIGIGRSCPVCGADGWGGRGPIGGTTEFSVSGVRSTLIACNRCGYVRIHAVEPLEALERQ